MRTGIYGQHKVVLADRASVRADVLGVVSVACCICGLSLLICLSSLPVGLTGMTTRNTVVRRVQIDHVRRCKRPR